MARADLLINLVQAGRIGDQKLFRHTVEAIAAEERAKQHNGLADRLIEELATGELGLGLLRNRVPKGDGAHEFVTEFASRRRLSDLILPDVVRDAVTELVEEQQRADLLRAHGLEPRHRVLLAGPPGNGKTSLAEALAGALMIPLLVVRYEAVIGSFLGETAVRLRVLFDHARSRQCVLFLDEFDVLGKERGDSQETGEIKRVVSSLLLQIDDLPSWTVVVTATNHPELLDRAVWRRFQLRLALPAPGPREIEEWVRRFENRLGKPLGVTAGTLAPKLAGLSFSELEDFGADIHRRYVLDQPSADVKRILRDRLAELRARVHPDGEQRTGDDGD